MERGKFVKKKWMFLILLSLISYGIGSGAVQADHDDDPPSLRGGSEEDVRNPDPVSIMELQMQFPGVVFFQGDPASNQIALTFDDGPDPRFTEPILDTLQFHDVPATFFVMGARAETYPEFLERMDEEGHDVGNHTFWHPNLAEESVEQMEWEVEQTEEVVEDVIGYRPRLFRPPYGNVTVEQTERLAALDNVVIGWSVDSMDWEQIPAGEIVENVLDHTGGGDIMLMHDGGDWTQEIQTPEALNDVITELQEQGYEFVTVSTMFDIPREK
ncbi:polysaccharide deacetylase family protein [Salicibibacter halophilus]|uniref:Polysaccharide deacetylase family protein n=1 Tax=Salicibibacter halophilus TaxID=2502791 RepID=A0A514LMG0_9BACI|nr:polysaccharide deacetylase family protein [Salicibibacter halophilus]